MFWNRWKTTLLLGLLLFASAYTGRAQTVSCSGIAAWSATTTYPAGAQVTYSGSLYSALVSTTNVPPNYCPACGWWQLLGTCGTVTSCTTVPAAPGGLSASGVTSSSVNLSWSGVATPANCTVTYSVSRGGSVVTSGLTGTTTTVSGLSAGTSYSFTVAAVDAAGTSAQSGAVSVTTTSTGCSTAPAVPTGLAASGVTSSSVTLSWSAVATPANCSVTYSVSRSGTVVASGLTATSAAISGLAASTTYSFTVTAADAAGSSAASAALSVTTSAGTGPTCFTPWSSTQVYTGGMTASENSINYTAAYWNQNSEPATHNGPAGSGQPWVSNGPCGGGGCSAVPAVPSGLASSAVTSSGLTLSWGAVAAPSGCSVTYKVFQNGTQVATPSSNSAAISGLAASTTYSFTVASVDAAGTSASSAALSVTTLAGQACTAAPSVPSGLSASGVTSSSVNLAWSASSAGAGCSITYNVYRGGSLVSTVPTTSAVVSGLAASTTYSFTVASVDAAGTSGQSAAISVTTSPVTTTTLPKHALTGYWQNFNNGAAVLRITDVPTSYDLICVAFADATSTPGAVAFNLDGSLGFSQAQFIADIATAKARGQHVILSVGGANGTISVADSASATAFANSVNSLMSTYGFEGVDIDFENGVNATYMAQALRAIRSGSIITLAPQTIDMQSTGGAYFQLALNISNILTICNMQYYNSGTMLGYDGKVYAEGTVDFLTALATIQLENGLRPDQVGLGLPASTSAAGGGYVSPSIVNQALGCLANGSNPGSFKPPHTYPTIRGAMTWSINWDASNGYNFANTVSPYLRSLP